MQYCVHLIECALQEVAHRLSQDAARELNIFKLRADELQRESLHGDDDALRVRRVQLLKDFEDSVERLVPLTSTAWDALREHASFRTRFDDYASDEKEATYLRLLTDAAKQQLGREEADDIRYVPLHAESIPYGESSVDRSKVRRSLRTRLVDRIANFREPMLVLLGHPGMGKSVAVRRAMIAIAERSLREKHRTIPLLVPLGKFGIGPEIIAQEALADNVEQDRWILGQIGAGLNATDEKDFRYASNHIGRQLGDLLNEQRCFLIFDGMDELPRSRYDETCRALVSFARRRTARRDNKNRFIFACREFDYPHELSVHALVLMPFDWRDVRRYLHFHLPAAALPGRRRELHALWRRGGAAKELLDNAFFLHLMTRHMCEHPTDSAPLTRGRLLKNYTERILRRKDKQEAQDKGDSVLSSTYILEDLAIWITSEKVSGTTASWQSLVRTSKGSDLAREFAPGSGVTARLRDFVEVDLVGVTFRHHRLREFFAAASLVREIHQACTGISRDDVREKFRESACRISLEIIAGDIWYFETIIMMASLLDSRFVPLLVEAILTERIDHHSPQPYRAIVAAECLEASGARSNDPVSGQVFTALKRCIRASKTTDIDKVECWKALSRVQVGSVQQGELPTMLDNPSRFVREEALLTIGRLGNLVHGRIAGCERACFLAVTGALKLAAVDRLLRYRAWVFSHSLRNLPLVVGYVGALMLSLSLWIAPIPVAAYLATEYLPPLVVPWLLPAVIATEVLLLEVFFLLNEDRRSVRGLVAAVRDTVMRVSSVNRDERSLARRAVLLWLAPQLLVALLPLAGYAALLDARAEEQERVRVAHLAAAAREKPKPAVSPQKKQAEPVQDKPVELAPKGSTLEERLLAYSRFSMFALDEVIRFIDKTDQPVRFLSKLCPDANKFALASMDIPAVRQVFSEELRHVARDVSLADEFNTVTRGGIGEFCENFFSSTTGGKGTGAETVLAWRRRTVQDDWRFETEFKITDPQEHEVNLPVEEMLFLLSPPYDRDHLHRVQASGLITFDVRNNATIHRRVEWFASSSRALIELAKELVSSEDPAPIPRQSMRRGYETLAAAFSSDTHDLKVAEENALKTLRVDREEWVRQRRDLQQARERAAAALVQAAEADRLARQARWEQGAMIFFAMFMVGIGAWVVWKYVLPRVQLMFLDPSVKENADALLVFANHPARDMGLRRSAIRKLAGLDDLGVGVGLERIIESVSTPEPLRVEAQQALRERHRRRMRRGVDV